MLTINEQHFTTLYPMTLIRNNVTCSLCERVEKPRVCSRWSGKNLVRNK